MKVRYQRSFLTLGPRSWHIIYFKITDIFLYCYKLLIFRVSYSLTRRNDIISISHIICSNQLHLQDSSKQPVIDTRSQPVKQKTKRTDPDQIDKVVSASVSPQWLYVDDNQAWAEYGQDDNTQYESPNSLDSQSLEKHFAANYNCFLAKRGNYEYQIDLHDMTQTNSETKTIRNIWRRVTRSSTLYGWFFRNPDGSWNQLKEIHSSAVEKHFSLTPETVLSSKKFSVNFEKMIMTRRHPKEDIRVRRVELCIVRDQQPQFLWQALNSDGNWNAIARGNVHMSKD